MTASSLTRASGPEHAVAAATGLGLVSPQPWLAAAEPGTGLHHLPLESALAGRRIEAGDHLTYALFPEPGADFESRWAGTAVAVILEFDDGTRVSDDAVDQYGAVVEPDAQAAAKRLWPEQWNRRTVGLSAYAGRTVATAAVMLRGHADAPVRCWVDDVRISGAPAPVEDLLDAVDTRRGTHSSGDFSRGNNAPLACVPHGGVFALPMTNASAGNWPYAYHANSRVDAGSGRVRPSLQGFATSHIPSPWMGDRGVFMLMPSPLTEPDDSREGRALWFDRDESTLPDGTAASPDAFEYAGPHEYRVRLHASAGGSASPVDAVLTAGHHAVGLGVVLPDGGSLIVDHHGSFADAAWELNGETLLITGVLDDRDDTPAQYVAVGIEGVTGVALRQEQDDAGRPTLRGHVTMRPGRAEAVVALSGIDAEQALFNLDAAGGVESLRAAARAAWSEVFGRISAEGSRDQLVTLASGLYRVFAYPQRAGERAADGSLRHKNVYGQALRSRIAPADAPEVAAGELTVTNGFWDTYRTEWPLLALLDPERAGELASGLLAHAEDSGWMPRWTAPAACDMMTGTSSDVVFADLALRGVPGFDVVAAYLTALKHACVPAPDSRVGRKGLRPGLFRGYINTATGEGMSWTLDNAINDAAAAALARRLAEGPEAADERLAGHDLAAEAEYLERRALGYRHIFHPGHQFFIGRDAAGEWRVDADFNPDVWGFDYTETNAWGTRFTVPHDPVGLAELYAETAGPQGGEAAGGEDAVVPDQLPGPDSAMGRALDAFMGRDERAEEATGGSYGFVIHEQKEARDCRQGMLALSNQPAHHIPFMYMGVGRHDDAHRVIRDALSRLFVGSDLGQGYPGDEDNGEMSAWWIFAAVGLYPLVSASGTYVLTPPVLRRFEASLGGERRLLVTAEGAAGAEAYIASVTVDGEPWEDISIPHERLAGGAHLHFELSEEPQGWAAGSRPASLSVARRERGGSTEYDGGALTDLLARSGAASAEHMTLVDDAGETSVVLAAGASATFALVAGEAAAADGSGARGAADRPAQLYTLTAAEAASGLAWRLVGIAADGVETVLDERRGEAFRWERQTRVFALDAAAPVVAVRLEAITELTLEQVELFA